MKAAGGVVALAWLSMPRAIGKSPMGRVDPVSRRGELHEIVACQRVHIVSIGDG